MATRTSRKGTIDTNINDFGNILPADVRDELKGIVDDSFNKDDDTSDNVTEGTTNKFLTAGNFATALAAQLAGAGGLSISRSGNTVTLTQVDTNTQLSNEQVEDIVGAMVNFTAGTSGATFEYNDTTGKLDIDFSSLTAGGGGGTFSPTAANIYTAVKAIITQGTNVTVTADDTGHTLTIASTAGSAGFTWPSTALTDLADEDELLVQDDTDSTTKAITVGNLKKIFGTAGDTPGGNPANHEQYWWGHQDTVPDGTWETTDAQASQDVRTAGTTFTINITGVLNGDYYYFIAPDDRLPTRITDGVGADRTNSFTTVALADLIGTTDFTAYYRQNNGGQTLPFSLTITTA